jgi:hypothetical protein
MRDLGCEHPPWINNNADNIITQLMALPKRSGSARIRDELETIIEEEGLWEYVRVYTDGSVMDERSGSCNCNGPEGGENQIG